MVLRVEPRGKSGNQQAFVITIDKESFPIIYDLRKGKVVSCISCTGECEHGYIIEEYLDLDLKPMKKKVDWNQVIRYVMTNYTRTSWRSLWSMLTDGMIVHGHQGRQMLERTRQEYKDLSFKKYEFYSRSETWKKEAFNPDGSWKDQDLEKKRQIFLNAEADFNAQMVQIVNSHLEEMDVETIGYLSICFPPEGIPYDDLSWRWREGCDWAEETMMALETYQYGLPVLVETGEKV
jgi:hypothetical protein